MKKIYLFLLLLFVCGASHAQTVNVSLVTAPCNNNGVLQASVTGMTGTVTYTFYSNHWTTILATNTSGTLTGYSGGPVWVLAGNGGATITKFYSGAPPFSYTVSKTVATCPAVSTATVAVTGGTSPYTVQWFNNNSTSVLATGSTVSLPAGDYDFLITDAAGCTYGTNAQDDSLYIYNNSSVNFSVGTTPASCTNGTATVTGITGGPSPYSYLWSNGATSSSLTGLVKGR